MSAYQRKLRPIDIDRGWIDYYTIADLYNFGSIVDHSIKKMMAAGHRNGGKSKLQDLKEARNQLDRAIEELEFDASNCESDIEMEVEKNRDDDQGKVVTKYQMLTDTEMEKVSDLLVIKPEDTPEGTTHFRINNYRSDDFYRVNNITEVWGKFYNGDWCEMSEPPQRPDELNRI